MKMLPEEFLARMKALLGTEFPAFLASYDAPPSRGLRVNTLKTDAEELAPLLPFTLTPAGIIPESFIIPDEAPLAGKSPYHAAGLYYLHEPSSALPIALANIAPGMKVLDMCAAPGGKSGAVAAELRGSGLLVANELVFSRARILEGTLERLGAANAAVMSARPESVAEAFPEFFDVVLVDAPCSGEGMFRKDDGAIEAWSVEHVRASAERQGLILDSAAKCVKGGGALIYSTCTFSHEENEGAIEAFLKRRPDFRLVRSERLYPHTSAGEGHFASRLERTAGAARAQGALPLSRMKDKAYSAFIDRTFSVPPEGEAFLLPDGRVTILRSPLPLGLERLRVLSSGVVAGEVVKGRFEPSHSLFMAAHGGEYRASLSLGADSHELRAFLAGETVECPGDISGFAPVCVKRWPVGFGKAGGGTMKNRVPKGLRMPCAR